MQKAFLSPYGKASAMPSPVNRMMASFADDFRDGIDINLGVGYVNQDTMPVAAIEEAVRYVLHHPGEHRQPLNYGGAAGSTGLIEALRAYYAAQTGIAPDVLASKRIIIGANGATSILHGLADIMPPGVVITADPMYYIYCNALERQGHRVVAVPEDHEGVPPEAVHEAIDALGAERHRIRFIYLVTIGNPTCTILPNARRRAFVEIATELSRDLGRPVPLVLDRAYEDLIHDPAVERPTSALAYDTDGIVYELGTLSKVLAPALRVGYLIGQDGPIMEALVQAASDIGLCASLLTQEMACYLLKHHIADQQARVNAGYRDRARRVRASIETHLGDEIEDLTGGSAGFYFYLTLRNTDAAEGSPFFRYLARTTGDPAIDGPAQHPAPRVVYIPGTFCVHPQGHCTKRGHRQLRISYGFEEPERIHEALQHMRNAIAYARG